MTQDRFVLAAALLVTLTTLACTNAVTPSLAPVPLAMLTAIQDAPSQTGTPIYEGRVSPLDGSAQDVLFRYERRVRLEEGHVTSSHITRNPAGEVVVLQRADHTPTYGLLSAEMLHRQAGTSSAVRVAGNQLTFTLTEGTKVSTATEVVSDPVVAGPTMFGYILTQWDALNAGQSLPIRFAVLERKETLGFTLKKVDAAPGRTVIRMTPTSLLVRLAVAPTEFEFDSTSRKILGYSGRVPPLRNVNGQLKTLDARVDYTFRAADFQ
jgi:hypothetical protein